MELEFLEKESVKAGKKGRRLAVFGFVLCIIIVGGLALLYKDGIDMNDYRNKEILFYASIMVGFLLIMSVIRFLRSGKTAKNGKNLILPFKEATKAEAAEIINREAAEGKILVDEYIDKFKEGEKPYGERVVLTPSYILLFNGIGPITAIPVSKVDWLCAEIGISGRSSFRVRLLVFTEKKYYALDGFDIDHAKSVAEKLYKYIPNIFSEYDYNFSLPHMLEKTFNKSREEYRSLIDSAKNPANTNL